MAVAETAIATTANRPVAARWDNTERVQGSPSSLFNSQARRVSRCPAIETWLDSDAFRLDSVDRVDPVNRPVERRHPPHAGAFGACNEVRLGEVQSIRLVHLEGPQQQSRVDADDGVERDQRPQGLGDLVARRPVERLQDVDRLRGNEIGKE